MKFKLNPAGLDEFLGERQRVNYLEELGDIVAHEVESQAERFAHTGAFARSIERLPAKRTAHGATVTVTSTDPDAHIIEWGSVNNPPYAPIRKAIRALGLRLREDRR